MMNVIDISEYQHGMNLSTMYSKNPDLGGVIIKATGGTCIFQEKTFKPWADWMIANNKPFGFYHFLDDDFRNSSGQAEAEFFVSKTKEYFGKGIPILDYEMQAKNLGVGYLKNALDTVYALTGVKPLVYCSQGLTAGMTSIANAGYKVWVAQYANYNKVYGFQSNPWKKGDVGPFGKEVMRQYTSQMYIPGWSKNLDASLFYGDRPDWDKLVGIEPVFPPPSQKKSLDEIAREVIDGKWGNGKNRQLALEKAGYSYNEVQAKVNEILSVKPKQQAESLTKIARDVIAGKYGNGQIRIARLRLAGYDPNAVQAEVNRILLGR